MERNFYDMTKVSGKAVNDAKRIQAQTADYLARHDRQLQESLQAEADAKMNAAMSGARFGYAANVARSNARINKLNEEIRYTNESSVIGMTEMVAQVVEAGLLLDESELVKIYPEYKEDIRSIVKGFLKEGELNSVITKDETLQLMEYVSKRLPSVREGVTLTEDELSNYMAINKPLDIDKSIKNLGGDVATRVATLMEKEQKKADQIEKDVKRAKAKEAKMAANDEVPAEELMQALDAGEISEDDLAEMLKNGEISQNTYDQVIGGYEEQAAAAQDPNAAGMDPAMAGGDPAAMGEDPNAMGGAPAGVAPGMPKKQIQMLPDGTMNINIYEAVNEMFEDFDLENLSEDTNNIRVGLPAKERELAYGDAILKRKKFDPEYILGKNVGLKSAVIKPLLLSLIPYVGTAIGAIVGIKNYSNNAHILRSEAYKELKQAVKEDPKCRNISKKIERELLNKEPDKYVLKQLRNEFTAAVENVKSDLTSNLTEAALFIKETPRCGLIESLAVNEADTMIREGKEYDGDLCLAKAIMYVTITEAMDELGLMNVDQKKYASIISAAGGNLNEGKSMHVIAGASRRTGAGKDTISKMEKANKKAPLKVIDLNGNVTYKNYKGKEISEEEYKKLNNTALTESILVNQYVPVRNDISNAESLADRIRKKRLNEQINLNE